MKSYVKVCTGHSTGYSEGPIRVTARVPQGLLQGLRQRAWKVFFLQRALYRILKKLVLHIGFRV